MIFSSTLFLLYFLPFFLVVYYLIDNKYKNACIVFFSVVFYMWGAPKFVFVILASIIVDYYLSHLIYEAEGKKRKIILVFSVCLNISILLYFKYANFFVENINSVLGSMGVKPMKWIEVALPIGISFFTFHELSYIIDVYRGVNKPMKKITDYAVYILLFPQLIAGPIIRYNEIANQIIDRRDQENIDNKLSGFFRFIIGLSKKVLIANVLGKEVDKIFALPFSELSSAQAWTGIIAYSFQIYFDFSGYSDMAIGIAKMLGIHFPENFNSPYISRNITEFWRRWHISLSRWMRDYLYIPLGGNKVTTARLYFNLWVVFLISGLWHGAQWTFVIWGAFHGLFLILDRLFLLRFTEKIGKFPSIIITYIIVLTGWVFFRSDNLNHALEFTGKMFSFNFSEKLFSEDYKFYFTLGIAALLSFLPSWKKTDAVQNLLLFKKPSSSGSVTLAFCSIALLILCIGSISSSGFNPFIYFRF